MHSSYELRPSEHPIGNMIKQMTLELKVNDQVDVVFSPTGVKV